MKERTISTQGPSDFLPLKPGSALTSTILSGWTPESPDLGRHRLKRRHRLRWVPVALGGVLLLASVAIGGAFVGVRHEQAHWRPIYNGAVTEVARWKSESETWQQSSDRYQKSSQQIKAQLQDLQGKVESSVGDLKNPRFTLWNS